jgi:hypothetical protein
MSVCVRASERAVVGPAGAGVATAPAGGAGATSWLT